MEKLEKERLKIAKIAAKNILGMSCRLKSVHNFVDKDINLYRFTQGCFIVKVKVDKVCKVVNTKLTIFGDIDEIENITDSDFERILKEDLNQS